MTKITVDREALDRWQEALKSRDPHIQQLAVNALRATAAQPAQEPVEDATMQSLKDLWRSVCDEVGKAAFAQPEQGEKNNG